MIELYDHIASARLTQFHAQMKTIVGLVTDSASAKQFLLYCIPRRLAAR